MNKSVLALTSLVLLFGLSLATGDRGESILLDNQRVLASAPRLLTPATAFELDKTYQQRGRDSRRVAGLVNGGYVMAWSADNGNNSPAFEVFAQIHNPSGEPIKPKFRIGSQTLASVPMVCVVGLSSGDFAVAWSGTNS